MVQIHKLRRYDTDCYIAVLDMQKVRIKIAYPFDTVTGAAQKHGADLAVNMGGWGLWPNESEPNEYLVIEGVVKQHKSYDSRPCIEITRDNQIKFHERPSLTKCWNVWGFDRFIARDGNFNTRIYNKKAVAPRTVYGVNIYGHLVIMVCEGRDAFQRGLTFPEVWDVIKEFNCTDVGNADGGFSSAMVYKGELLNSSYRKGYRRVVSQLLVYFDTNVEVPQTGGNMPTYEVIKSARYRSAPTMTTNDTGASSTVGFTFDSEVTQVDQNNPAITMVQVPKLTPNWLPLEINGTVYTRQLDGPAPLPVEEFIEYVRGNVRRKFIPEG